MSLQYVQSLAISLYSGMAISDTSCRVTPYPVDLDGVKLTMADFGTTAYFTIDPKISGYEEICSFTGITDNGDGTATLTGLTRNLLGKYPYTASSSGGKLHGSSAVVVFSDNPQIYGNLKAYIDAAAIAGAVNASTSVQGLLQLPTTAQVNAGTATGSTGAPLGVTPDTLAASIYSTQLPSAVQKTLLTTLYGCFAGTAFPTGRRTAASGTFFFDGSAVSRASYPLTFAALCPSVAATFTNSSSAVVATAHGLVVGDKIHFTTTGSLPTGWAANTDYYVKTVTDANTIVTALSPAGTTITAGSAGSGVHTMYESAWGKGDGSTTFNLPDLRGKSILGVGATNNFSLAFEVGAVGTNTIAVPDGIFPSQGQAITLTGTLPTGLATSTTYYVNRISSTSISLSTTQALANAATPDKTFTSSGMSGVCTIVYTLTARTILGRGFGEEAHGLSQGELASHTHTTPLWSSNNNSQFASAVGNGLYSSSGGQISTGSVGSDTQHNNMSPSIQMNWYGIAI